MSNDAAAPADSGQRGQGAAQETAASELKEPELPPVASKMVPSG